MINNIYSRHLLQDYCQKKKIDCSKEEWIKTISTQQKYWIYTLLPKGFYLARARISYEAAYTEYTGLVKSGDRQSTVLAYLTC